MLNFKTKEQEVLTNKNQSGTTNEKAWYRRTKFTLGTGGGLVLHDLVRSLQRKLTNESIWGWELYRYSATSVSEYPMTCIVHIQSFNYKNIRLKIHSVPKSKQSFINSQCITVNGLKIRPLDKLFQLSCIPSYTVLQCLALPADKNKQTLELCWTTRSSISQWFSAALTPLI